MNKNTFQDMNEEFVLYVIILIEVFLLDTKGRRICLEVFLLDILLILNEDDFKCL